MTTEAPFGLRVTRAAVDAALAELDGLVVDTDPARVKRRSRDFYWYSPILRERLDAVSADAVVAPADEDELKRLLAACYRHDVPVTVRGAGTGNSGHAMPLRGGIVLDMGYFNRVVAIDQGWCRAQAGCVLGVLDHALHERGQTLRIHPSTIASATVGGFVAGGSAGVGSIAWGTLRDLGAVRALRVVTMEAAPRTLELRGAHVGLARHGFGTTGVITEVELPTAPRIRWLERVVGFAALEPALRFAAALAHADAIPKRLVSVVAAPAAGRYLFPHGVDEATHVVLVMAAEASGEAVQELVAAHGARALSVAGSPLYEYAWNHTTLHTLKHDRDWTYLDVAYPPPDTVAKVLELAHAFATDELVTHVEFVRADGIVTCTGLPLVRFIGRDRLQAVVGRHAQAGCSVVDPQGAALASGGVRQLDARRLAFKHEVDPKNLLNPGMPWTFDAPPTGHLPPPPVGSANG